MIVVHGPVRASQNTWRDYHTIGLVGNAASTITLTFGMQRPLGSWGHSGEGGCQTFAVFCDARRVR